jgi:signal transduction histidine kinase
MLCRPQTHAAGQLVIAATESLRVGVAEDELISVLANLIVNATHAVPAGKGRIEVHADVGPHDSVEIRVKDNGCGIAPENLSKIFSPSFTTKAVGKGTGLGLHLVQRIVTAAGGRIAVESTVGQGTCFTLILPVLR